MRPDRARAWAELIESEEQDLRTSQEIASLARVREAHDRWAYWVAQVYAKGTRVPVREEIWDEEIIPLRQPIEECPE